MHTGISTPSLFAILETPASHEISAYNDLLAANRRRHRRLRLLAHELYKASPLDPQSTSRRNSVEGSDMCVADVEDDGEVKDAVDEDVSYEEEEEDEDPFVQEVCV